MKRFWICCLAVVLVLALAACGGGESAGNEGGNDAPATTVDLKALKDSILSQVPITDPLDLQDGYLKDTLGIDDADVKSWSGATSLAGSTGFPDELVLIEAADKDAAGRVKTALENHIENMKTQAKDYSPEGYALAESCKVLQEGNYLALFLCTGHESMEPLFEGAF